MRSVLALAVILEWAGITPILGQNTGAPSNLPIPTRVVSSARSVPAPPPDAAPSAAPIPSAGDDTIPRIDFPNTDIRQVLEFYETLTGKKALYDNTVQGNIRVRVATPVAKAEAVRILETVFALNNFTLIPGGGDIVKVIFTSKNVRQFDIPICSDLDQLPPGNQVVSFLFKLEYADPQEVKTAIDQVISPTPSITNIVALPKSQAVLVTENSDMIRNLAKVVAQLDGKPAEVVSIFIPLERADAKEVVEKLTKMFEKNPNGNGNTNSPVAALPGNPKQPAGAESSVVTISEDSMIVGKIKMEADLRTNRIHVVTRPVNLPFLRRLIADLDSGIPQGVPSTRPLQFVLAGDILDIVAGAVAEPGVEVKKLDSGGGRSTSGASPISNSTGNLSSNNSTSGRSNSRSSGVTSSSALNSTGVTQQTDTAPEGRIIRNTKIIADNRTNAIIVVGNDEMKRKVFNLLDQIDVRAPQVLLTAVIGELTLDNTEEFGVDYLLTKGNLPQSIISGTLPWSVPGSSVTGSLKNYMSAASMVASGGGVTGLIGVGNSLDIYVKALQSTGRYKITSRPMIFTSNNRAAMISSGESIAIPSTINSSYTTNNSLVSTSSVDYIDVALKLSVLPLINSNGEVTLQISQDDNNTNGKTTISGNDFPTVTTRAINTTVSVANDSTIVLGGLVSEKKQVSKSGVPILGKLPYVGPLFSYTSNVKTRTELIVLLKPTVTNGPVQAVKAGERTMQKTNFEPDLDATLDPPGRKYKKAFVIPKPTLCPEP